MMIMINIGCLIHKLRILIKIFLLIIGLWSLGKEVPWGHRGLNGFFCVGGGGAFGL